MAFSGIDISDVLRGLDRLDTKVRGDLARSMAVAGGKVIRDEARARAPVGGYGTFGSITPGLLKSAIYVAYSDRKSTEGQKTYTVSWNSRKAPHGHLLEFGHWQNYAWFIAKDGEIYTDKSRRFKTPRWVAAHPFLRPAFDAAGERAYIAMITRGRERLPELLESTS